MATMIGTLVLARIAGTGEFSDEILAAGRDAVLNARGEGRREEARGEVEKAN